MCDHKSACRSIREIDSLVKICTWEIALEVTRLIGKDALNRAGPYPDQEVFASQDRAWLP
jgi:hypothetical protein